MITACEKYRNNMIRDNGARRYLSGSQTLYRFENNYGVSVVFGQGTYGLEAAIVYFPTESNDSWQLSYESGIGMNTYDKFENYNDNEWRDVFGYLDDMKIESLLDCVSKLEKKNG